MTPTRKKLIEVALPLEAINKASVREGYIYRGNPSALHKWWAQRPLAAARAVIFSQMVDDPSEYVDVLKSDPKLLRQAEKVLKPRHKVWQEAFSLKERADQAGISAPAPGPEPTLEDILAEIERQRLFRIIEDLVLWENTTNEDVLKKAREEIWLSWRRTCAEYAGHARAKELFDRNKLPGFHDPFAGGGTLPLEAQRLGLQACASDLNPVAVILNKAMIEIPPKFTGRNPVNPDSSKGQLGTKTWRGSQGLADDVRYYGQWMREEAEKRIGHFYPKIEITPEVAQERPDLKPLVGQKLTIIAWLWARTVKSPNPAFCEVDVPLASTFMLSTKPGKEAWVEPVIEDRGYRFMVKVGKPKNADATKNGTKLLRANFQCLMSGTPIAGDYIRAEAKAGRMGSRLMALVVESDLGRMYLSPTQEQDIAAYSAVPEWKPEIEFFQQALGFRVGNYGMTKWSDLFTSRQLMALTTFSNLVTEVSEHIRLDAIACNFIEDDTPLAKGGAGALAYAEAVTVYLAFGVDKYSIYGNSLVPWYSKESRPSMLFGQQVVSMVWDYTEVNPFSEIGGSFARSQEIVAGSLEGLPHNPSCAIVLQADAAKGNPESKDSVVSTDPPYYDNVGYADLSDFFYVWLRRSLRPLFPEIFATLTVPKTEELVATPDRHGGKRAAETFFLEGMTEAMHRLANQSHPTFPVTIYYAFKQSEGDSDAGTASTGWETFLQAVINAGFAISGTWPMRTERKGRARDTGSNALASSIVLVCRPRTVDAPTATRREFVAALQRELPEALRHLQAGNIAPVDLAQASIGPGMAVYTRYAQVLDAQGKALTVREALALINETLDTALAEQEGDFDPDSRWALAWFDQFGFDEGEFGVAETLSKAKNTSIAGLAEAGILESARGRVRLLRPEELPADWAPATDSRLTHWETVHHMIRVLATGESAAAELMSKLGAKAEPARELAYRLFTLCERKKRAAEALAYNGLVQAWPDLLRIAEENPPPQDPVQGQFF